MPSYIALLCEICWLKAMIAGWKRSSTARHSSLLMTEVKWQRIDHALKGTRVACIGAITKPFHEISNCFSTTLKARSAWGMDSSNTLAHCSGVIAA